MSEIVYKIADFFLKVVRPIHGVFWVASMAAMQRERKLAKICSASGFDQERTMLLVAKKLAIAIFTTIPNQERTFNEVDDDILDVLATNRQESVGMTSALTRPHLGHVSINSRTSVFTSGHLLHG